MEKVLYSVWKDSDLSGDEFRRQLLPVLAGVSDANVRALRLAVVDSAVDPAAGKRMQNCQPLPAGLVSVWFGDGGQRASMEAALASSVARYCAYLVTESEPLANCREAEDDSGRLPGFCQVVFLKRPPRLRRPQWLALWQGSHTQVAIDTQSTFGYRQNVVVRPLGYGQPDIDAVIEENFPTPAMTSEQHFYGVTDDEGLERNREAMISSCARFIDFDKIDVVPMSEYRLKG